MTPELYRPVSYLEANAARRPDTLAVSDEAEEITFGRLLHQVRRLRCVLASRGVKAGDVVGVQLANVWEYVALELAIPDLGAVLLPLPLGLGEHELAWVNEKTRPALIIRDQLEGLASVPDPLTAPPDPDRIVEIKPYGV